MLGQPPTAALGVNCDDGVRTTLLLAFSYRFFTWKRPWSVLRGVVKLQHCCTHHHSFSGKMYLPTHLDVACWS